MVTKDGAFTFVEDEEMRRAEEFASRIADFLADLRKQLLSADPKDAKKVDTKRSLDLANEAEDMPFSLAWLDKTGWKPRKRKALPEKGESPSGKEGEDPERS